MSGSIKNYLFRLRRYRGYSQKQFAQLLGLRDRKSICDYERGKYLPDAKTAMLMEIVLSTKLSEIYPDLYEDLTAQAVTREGRLPSRFGRHIRGRVLGKDEMPILETVEKGLKDFRPKTHRQFVVFNIAQRFGDLANLARYLNVCDGHPKKVLLEAARLAEQHALRDETSPVEVFFRLLAEWRREEDP